VAFVSAIYSSVSYCKNRTWFTFFLFRTGFTVFIGSICNEVGLVYGLFPDIALSILFFVGGLGTWLYILLVIFRFKIFAALQPEWLRNLLDIKVIASTSFIVMIALCWPLLVRAVLEKSLPGFVDYERIGFYTWSSIWLITDFVLGIVSLHYVVQLKKSVAASSGSDLSLKQKRRYFTCVVILVLQGGIDVAGEVIMGSESVQGRMMSGNKLSVWFSLGMLHVATSFFYMFEIALLVKHDSDFILQQTEKTGKTSGKSTHTGSNSNHEKEKESNKVLDKMGITNRPTEVVTQEISQQS